MLVPVWRRAGGGGGEGERGREGGGEVSVQEAACRWERCGEEVCACLRKGG